jgi:hypothetical protein
MGAEKNLADEAHSILETRLFIGSNAPLGAKGAKPRLSLGV